MAIARLSVGIGSKGKASPHALYIAREGKYAKPSDSLEKLENTDHGNMPKWAQHEPNFFWKMADEHERKNGSTYREHVIALPRELNESQRLELVHDWIAQEIGEKHAYQFAIHNPPALDGGEQPHCHLMFSERTRDGIERDPDQYFKRYNSKNPEKGGAKKANTGIAPADRRADLLEQRERWEQTCNKHLELAHCYARISMKSLKAQGIDREPFNISMIKINKPSIRQIYEQQLTAAESFKQARLDSLTVNVIDELSKINEKYYERTERAINTTKQRIAETERLVSSREKRSNWADKTDQFFSTANARSTKRIRNTEQEVARSEQLSTVANQAINSADRTIARRLEQRQEQLDRISQRPISELLRLEFRVVILSEHGSSLRDTVERVSESFYELYRQARRDKLQVSISSKDSSGRNTNSETIGNATAQSVERFMMRKENLSNIDVLSDFESNMNVQDFTKKYSLKCDLSDLKRLDELYPVEPELELKTANLSNIEPKNDNDHDFSM